MNAIVHPYFQLSPPFSKFPTGRSVNYSIYSFPDFGSSLLEISISNYMDLMLDTVLDTEMYEEVERL